MVRASNSSFLKKIWPVERFELKKILPLLFLKFLVSISYSLLTSMKDTLVVTAQDSGAEIIPVLKGWFVFPISICCAIAYTKLSNRFSRSTLFYSIITGFLAIIALYSFVLYPNAASITPTASANVLMQKLGPSFSHFIAVYKYWFHSLFFVTAELWGQVVIFLLYWGFANHITNMNEAKRTYTLFIAAGDVATILAGPLTLFYINKYIDVDYLVTFQSLMGYVIACGILMMATYYWMTRNVLTDKRYFDPEVMKVKVNSKTKLSLKESIKHIFSSKYLLSIAVLVISIALTINIIEVTWKANLKIMYPTAAQYQAFTSKMTSIVGIVALILAVFVSGNLLRRSGWLFSAKISPIAIGLSGLIFFLMCQFKSHLGFMEVLFGITPLAAIVAFGAFQNILSKVVKYSFFDSTKEMAYIPLDYESKVKGKAAIDMVGSRFGKSGSSVIQLVLIQIAGTGSILSTTPYLIPVVLFISFMWLRSVGFIGKQLSEKEEAAALLEAEKVAAEAASAEEELAQS